MGRTGALRAKRLGVVLGVVVSLIVATCFNVFLAGVFLSSTLLL